MTPAFVPTILAALALSACGAAPIHEPASPIGSNNSTAELLNHKAGAGLPAAVSWKPGNSLPLVRINTSLSQSMLAQQALVAGGRVLSSALRVDLSGHSVMASLAEVEGVLFLVTRLPDAGLPDAVRPDTGAPTPVRADIDRVLLDAVQQLTGCDHQDLVYRAGESPDRPEALAIPLSCG